ncbi:hypothetical protein IT570_03380 [Candidatus Sumerlaeota bacterium]|nr:hypothetical protein [Candidatus Sumerlaeota bacterium]
MNQADKTLILAKATSRHLAGEKPLLDWQIVHEDENCIVFGLVCAKQIEIRQDKKTQLCFIGERAFEGIGFQSFELCQLCGEEMMLGMVLPLLERHVLPVAQRITKAALAILVAESSQAGFTARDIAAQRMIFAEVLEADENSNLAKAVEHATEFVLNEAGG